MAETSTTPRISTPAENMRGSILMAMAMAGFGLNDIVVKHLSSTLELGQTIFLRGLFATLFIFILAVFTGNLRPARTMLQPAMLVRAMGEVLATVTFLIALFNIPIANTTAILQVLPMVVTLGAAIFFGEKFGWRSMAAISLGFIGVLLIIRPGMEGFTAYSVVVLGTVVFAATRDLSTRFISKNTPSLFIALLTSILVTTMGATLSVFGEWKPVEPVSIALLALAAGFLVVAYLTIAASMRVGDVSVIVPFRYSILLYAILAGIFIFDEIPDAMTIFGSAIIVSTGIYTFYRERLRSRKIAKAVRPD